MILKKVSHLSLDIPSEPVVTAVHCTLHTADSVWSWPDLDMTIWYNKLSFNVALVPQYGNNNMIQYHQNPHHHQNLINQMNKTFQQKLKIRRHLAPAQ